MDHHDTSSDDEEEDTSELSTTKKGMSLDMYFKMHGIAVEDLEDEEDDEHDAENIEGIGEQEPNGSNEGTVKKKTRGKTICKKLHDTDFKDRKEVEFYQGQPIGPTLEVVSDLSQCLGTTIRNHRFVTLLYTSWHGVPVELKENMWEYVNKKFILPTISKPWVMKGLAGAWKKYKREVKRKHFLKYSSKKQMLRNRPSDIPEVQFRKLIRYWSLPEIMAMSTKNTENRSKQTCPHRMGSTNFGIVRKQLRDSKENNEEPSRAEIFTATRTSKKGKEVDAKTQTVIAELQNRIENGENHEDAFVAVLGKDNPGRVRCYGATVTKTSLKRDEEIRQIKAECNEKVLSLENKVDSLCGVLKGILQQLNPGMSMEDVEALVHATHNSPLDASSRPRNTPRSSESTHIPDNGNGNVDNDGAHNGRRTN